MTHAPSLSRRCALTALVATFFLAAQQRTNWEAHFQEGAGPAKRLQVVHSVIPADMATLIAAAMPDLAEQESAACASPPPEPCPWPWSEETWSTRLAAARAVLANRHNDRGEKGDIAHLRTKGS